MKKFGLLLMVAALSVSMAACGGKEKSNGKQLSGEVHIDGSSTVFPIMEAVSEEYLGEQPDVKASVGVAGTGGGFKKFTNGDTDLSNASREIKQEEADIAKKNGIEYEVFELAFDGITVAVSKDNDWAKDLTVEQLKKIWIEDGKTKKWSDLDPSWPKEDIKFYSPGADSGTYDYFDEVILDGKQMVKTATLSEDDNVLVSGVAGDKYSIGFFGFSYYTENKDKLTALKINGVEPTHETIKSKEYAPLSRPLYTYVNKKSVAEKPQVYDYLRFTLENCGPLAEEVGYVSLPEEDYTKQLDKLESLKK